MENVLPAIPPKRYFTIGEVSELCGVKPYVLRYWEQEFTQLRPMKRRGNRRYYQHHEVLLIRRIRDLLYEQGFTISGARNRLSEVGAQQLATSLDEEGGDAPNFLANEADPLHVELEAQAESGDVDQALSSTAPVDSIVVSRNVPRVDGGQTTVSSASKATQIPVPHAVLLTVQLLRSELQLIKELLTPGQEA